MSVEHAVELALDEPASDRVVELMARLERAGVRSLRQLAPAAHPHVSLAVAAGDPMAVAEACDGLAGIASSLTLRLAALGAFVRPARVAFLAVTPSAPLLALNAEVHDRLDARGLVPRPLYRPGHYVPHVTLAMHVDELAAALAALEDVDLPIEASCARLGVVEVPTGRVVATIG